VRHCLVEDANEVVKGWTFNSGPTWIESNHMTVTHNADEGKCISEWSGVGPFVVQNNYLAGSSIPFLMGGALGIVQGETSPRGVFRCNEVEFPLSWAMDYGFKNAWELKHGEGWVVEGNVFKNYRIFSQNKALVLNNVIDTSGKMNKTTVRYNKWVDCESWWGYGYVEKPDSHSILFHDNLFTGGCNPYDGTDDATDLMNLKQNIPGVIMHHNTVVGRFDGEWKTPTGFMQFPLGVAGTGHLTFRDNIVIMGWRPSMGFMMIHEGTAYNQAALNSAYGAGNWVFSNNALAREDSISHAMPDGNDYYTGGTRLDDMLAKLNADYSVKASQTGTDWNTYSSTGGRIGADIALVNEWTDGVEAGEPTALRRGLHLGVPGVGA